MAVKLIVRGTRISKKTASDPERLSGTGSDLAKNSEPGLRRMKHITIKTSQQARTTKIGNLV
jgi:hypothetical protein